ncbi:putative Nudix hydrolase NudL [Grifola frondosa]|uniref:Putative Nudix hydrolase NudL n=1 Tax=Grifola frondosa TaxID=5627 RepID=A0A1C7MBI6_GRIFR|nr:putative Nudix hydrolase NudL [Grifola frondosa]
MFRTLTTATASSSSRPLTTPSHISLTAPLTRSSLSAINVALSSAFSEAANIYDSAETHAAVLVPFCNVNGRPGILLEVRGKLRTHSGELPRGRVDKIDQSTLAAALRETQEEIGIHPDQIEILGRFGPPEHSLGGMRVWPYVGFIHSESQPALSVSRRNPTYDHNLTAGADTDPDAPLPSLAMSSLILSPKEVAHAFHLPLSALLSPPRLHSYLFRGARPYYAINVDDLVACPDTVHSNSEEVLWIDDPEQRDEVGGGRNGRLEVGG